MAIYKPSNFSPLLQEVDITENNTFSCQVNTSGESVKAYKLSILDTEGETLYESECTDLAVPVKNKNILNVENVSNALSSSLQNGKNYQWSIRTYNQSKGATTQPNTVVCTGYLVGSTQYVIWTNNNEKLAYDRYLEISTTGPDQIFPIVGSNPDNISLPQTGETFRERIKIDWVEPELGFDKDYTKIELVDGFTYSYKDGTPFSIYLCSDEHGLTNVYVDPNDQIEEANYMTIYENEEQAQQAHEAGDTPAKITVQPLEKGRKIIGYSSVTGEVRFQEPFTQIPQNGNAYLLYEFDSVSNTYTEKTSDVSQIIGGSPITDDSFVIITNKWDSETKRLFIQPNINIKTDDTNPNEIIFADGTRMDIIKTTSDEIVEGKTVDITIDKLDNTQWVLKYLSTTSDNVPIAPKNTYTVYTDFMDSSPYNVFYTRATPTITMQYKNLNDESSTYENISSTGYKDYRDISFNTTFVSENGTQPKYYQYFLYDSNNYLIASSEEIFSTDLQWQFRGFESGITPTSPNSYKIQIKIVDDLSKEFIVENEFNIYYGIEAGIVPMEIDLDCEKMALKLVVSSPVYVESTDVDGLQTVTWNNMNEYYDYLEIPEGMVLNYTNVVNPTETPIIIPKTFSYLMQFQITSEFISLIKNADEAEIFQVAHKIDDTTFDVFSFKIGGSSTFYVTDGNIVQKNNNQLKIRVYKNGGTTPLTCFNGGTSDNYDIIASDIYGDFVSSDTIKYALQQNSDYIIISMFPNKPVAGQKYLLQNDTTLNGTIYYAGIYTYNNGWQVDLSAEFIFVESLSQVPGYDNSSFYVPENCQTEDGTLQFQETNNLWVDNENYINRFNETNLGKKWFNLYFIVDNTTSTETTSCQIQMLNERT